MNSEQKTSNQTPPELGLGDRLREARERKGLSQEGLSRLTKDMDSEKVGISRPVLTGYEKGKFKPGTRELRILYESLGITPNWLILGGSDPDRIQSQFKSQEEFESELLSAIRALDSESLNGVVHLIFAAAPVAAKMHAKLDGLVKVADDLIDKVESSTKELEKLKSSQKELKKLQSLAASKESK